MRRTILLTLATIMSLMMLFAAAPAALAEETTCVGTIGARTLDNVRVPQGKACTLNGTRVKGTVKVERAATLKATNVRVNGNVQAENHKSVAVLDSTVGGQIQLVQGGVFKIDTVQITGGILVDENTGQSRLSANTVNQDIQVFAHDGGVAITKNRVDGNLQCKENTPPPTGGGNRVEGNKEDQCKRL